MVVNESVVLRIVQPYVKDSAITYEDFECVFRDINRHEQYDAVEILYRNGINLIDGEDLLSEIDTSDEDVSLIKVGDIRCDDLSIFTDTDEESHREECLVINRVIKQSNEVLCALIQEGNRQSAQDLCIKNKRLVDKYVMAYQKRYGNRLDFEDLEQAGFIGLIQAAKKFKLHQGTKFSTYAVFWIRQSISREIMDNGYAIRIPVHMMERINKVVTVDNRLIGEGVCLYSRIRQIALEVGITEEDTRECLMLKKNFLSYSSLNAYVGEDSDTEIAELVVDDETKSVEAIAMSHALHEELTQILQSLSRRERQVIELRFGLHDGNDRTLEEVGMMLNVTRERIRQIEAKALKKLSMPRRAQRLKAFREE